MSLYRDIATAPINYDPYDRQLNEYTHINQSLTFEAESLKHKLSELYKVLYDYERKLEETETRASFFQNEADSLKYELSKSLRDFQGSSTTVFHDLRELERENAFLRDELQRKREPIYMPREPIQPPVHYHDDSHLREKIRQLEEEVEYLRELLRDRDQQIELLKNRKIEEKIVYKERPGIIKPQSTIVKPELNQDLLNDMLGVLAYIREMIVDILFEIFCRSGDHATKKKINSLILFILNMQELKKKHLKAFLVLLRLYAKMKQAIRKHHQSYAKLRNLKLTEQEIDPSKFPEDKDLLIFDLDYRENFNKFVEQTLAHIKTRRKTDVLDKNKHYNELFRLLALKYRSMYPSSGKQVKVDNDIKIYIEDKICKAASRVFEDIEDLDVVDRGPVQNKENIAAKFLEILNTKKK